MQKQLEQLKDFHEAFGCVLNETPTIPDAETALLRTKLMVSENAETVEAIANKDMLEILDGLVDKLYVTLGTAVSYGLADILPAAFQLVHENNMSKLGPDGKPIKDASGKVVKPEGYVPVDLRPLLEGALLKCSTCDRLGHHTCPHPATSCPDRVSCDKYLNED